MKILRIINVWHLKKIDGQMQGVEILYSIILHYNDWKKIKPFITPYYEEGDEVFYHLIYGIDKELADKMNKIGLNIIFDFEKYGYSLEVVSTEGFLLDQLD